MIRGVLFDLDGTLFDRATSLTACIEAQHGRQAGILRVVSAQDYVTRFVELDARGYIQGAHNAGMCAVWKRDSYWGGCPDADAIVDDLRSLPTTISALSVYLSPNNGLRPE